MTSASWHGRLAQTAVSEGYLDALQECVGEIDCCLSKRGGQQRLHDLLVPEVHLTLPWRWRRNRWLASRFREGAIQHPDIGQPAAPTLGDFQTGPWGGWVRPFQQAMVA